MESIRVFQIELSKFFNSLIPFDLKFLNLVLGVGRKLLNLRLEAQKFLKFEVGNGQAIHLWADWWHLECALYDRFGYRVIYDANSNINAKLSTVLRDSNWFWGSARSEDLVVIQSQLSMVDLGESDTPVWVVSKTGKLSSYDTWDA